MQIHELNNFSGTLGSGAYLAIDDGNDTSKISSQGLLAATEARIDNIIAGPAPSAEEIVDARLGDDGVTYPSLGDAIRDQFSDVKSNLSEESNNLDNKINVVAGISANPHVHQLVWLLDIWKTTGNNRIYTNELPLYGTKLKIKTSASYLFAPIQRDNATIYASWTNEYTAPIGSFTNGLMLWIKKADSSNFVDDAEYKDAVANTTVSYYIEHYTEQVKTMYVAPYGNDVTYDGSKTYPFATVNKAIQKGAKKIMLASGKYKQGIALPDFGEIEIAPIKSNAFPIFYGSNCTEITAPTLHGNGVYKYETTASLISTTPWIFQDGVADTSTEINSADRMPQQKNQQYRCTDTIIKRCESATLADALTEIEGSAEPLFFYDSDNTMLYFKPASTSFATYPIIIPADDTLFSNLSSNVTLKVSGIHAKYTKFDISNTTNSVIADCKCSGAYAPSSGQFAYDDALNATFINCEASMSHGTSGYGDGFNSHSTFTGDVGAIRSGVRLINCWSHDNMDDGYSDHNQGFAEIVGGLFEYNGKGGVTPSYTTNCMCRDVMCRNNYNGFYVTGDGINKAIFSAFNCISKDNMRGGNSHYHAGFFVSDYNANLYNCISIGNKTGYSIAKSTDVANLIDCKSSGDERMVRGSGIVNIVNGSQVTV